VRTKETQGAPGWIRDVDRGNDDETTTAYYWYVEEVEEEATKVYK